MYVLFLYLFTIIGDLFNHFAGAARWQVGFLVNTISNPTSASRQTGDMLLFTNEVYDLNDNYNMTTGIFVAPVDGLYTFFVVAEVEASRRPLTFHILVDGDVKARGSSFNANSGYFNSAGSTHVVCFLAQGAEVSVQHGTDFGDGGNYGASEINQFAGMLVTPTFS